MRNYPWVVCMVLCAVHCVAIHPAHGEPLTPSGSPFADAVSARQSIDNIVLSISVDNTQGGKTRRYRAKTWTTKTSRREDQQLASGVDRNGNPAKEIKCTTPDHEIYVNTTVDPATGGLAVHYYDMHGPNRRGSSIRPLNPLIIGMIPCRVANTSLRNFSIGATLLNPTHSIISEESVDWNGAPATSVKYKMRTGNATGTVVLTGAPPIIVSYMCEDPTTKEEVVVQETTDLGGHGKFPKSVIYRRWKSGDLVEEESAQIEVESVGKPIEASVFTLTGMDLPRGMGVHTDPPQATVPLYWNGTEITEVATSTSDSNGGFPSLWAIVAGGLLAIGLFVLVRANMGKR